jgi:hypothetical protein
LEAVKVWETSFFAPKAVFQIVSGNSAAPTPQQTVRDARPDIIGYPGLDIRVRIVRVFKQEKESG